MEPARYGMATIAASVAAMVERLDGAEADGEEPGFVVMRFRDLEAKLPGLMEQPERSEDAANSAKKGKLDRDEVIKRRVILLLIRSDRGRIKKAGTCEIGSRRIGRSSRA